MSKAKLPGEGFPVNTEMLIEECVRSFQYPQDRRLGPLLCSEFTNDFPLTLYKVCVYTDY